MSMYKKKFTSVFKVRVALEALKENSTLEALSKRFEVSPATITSWRKELLSNAMQAFETHKDDSKMLRKVRSRNDCLDL